MGIVLGFIPALIMYFVKQDDEYLKKQSMEALNYQITVFIFVIISYALVFVYIGILLLIIVGFSNLILCIIAAVKVCKSGDYKYPMTFRILKSGSNKLPQNKEGYYESKISGISKSIDTFFCHSCGQSIDSGNLFCTRCGSKQ